MSESTGFRMFEITTIIFSMAMVPTLRVNVRLAIVQGTVFKAPVDLCSLHPEYEISARGSNSKGKITLIFAESGTVDYGVNPIEYSVYNPFVD